MIEKLFLSKEKREMKEMKKVYSLLNQNSENDYRTIHEYVSDCVEALDIMKNSDIKDTYAPEDVPKLIKDKIFSHVKDSNDIQEKVSDLFLGRNGHRGYIPFKEKLEGILKEEQANKYCFKRKLWDLKQDKKEIYESMAKTLKENKDYTPQLIFNFDKNADNMEKLTSDFGKINDTDYSIPLKYTACFLSKFVDLDAEALASNYAFEVGNEITSLVRKYLKKDSSINEDEKQKIFSDLKESVGLLNEKVFGVKEKLEKIQDNLYDIALNSAKNKDPDYEEQLEKFLIHSRNYSKILGETETTLKGATIDINAAYLN